MVDFLDLYERSLSGPIMSEKDFDIEVFIPALNKVVREYEIMYDGANPVPFNDQLADTLYQASVDFLSQVGVYCMGTNRIIKFSKREI